MESRVNGAPTPLSLGELRQAILAVVVGSPLFTPAEQFNINHFAHESEDEQELAQTLRALRMLDVERADKARLFRHHAYGHQRPVCYDKAQQAAELEALLQYKALRYQQKRGVLLLAGNAIYTPSVRLRFLGDAYFCILHNLGYREAMNKLTGLFSN